MREAALGDAMGMGKTCQTLIAYLIDLYGVMQEQGVKMPRDRIPLDNRGMFKGRKPWIGATFVSASPSGVEPWICNFKKLMDHSWFATSCEAAKFRPRLIVMHRESSRVPALYDGDKWEMSYSSNFSDELIREISRLPNWD